LVLTCRSWWCKIAKKSTKKVKNWNVRIFSAERRHHDGTIGYSHQNVDTLQAVPLWYCLPQIVGTLLKYKKNKEDKITIFVWNRNFFLIFFLTFITSLYLYLYQNWNIRYIQRFKYKHFPTFWSLLSSNCGKQICRD